MDRAPKRREFLAFGKPNFCEEELRAVSRVIHSGWIGMGAETLAFESELAAYLGVPHVVSVNSCTSALFLALVAHGVGPGDEVVCPSLTWCATANAAMYLGAIPVFCDIDPDTMCATPETVAAKLTPKTKAVMLVHYGGRAVDVAGIRSVLREGVAIVEDAAHALGSRFADGTRVGSSGNLTCFSFYANKNLATGEGGAIALRDDALAERLRRLRQSGQAVDAWKRYSHPQNPFVPLLTELGYKMNFTDLQAAIGRIQLKRQAEFSPIRAAIARRYHEALGHSGLQLGFQAGVLEEAHARHLFVVTLPIESMRMSRDEFIVAMRFRNLGVSVHYAPLHLMPLYPGAGSRLPKTEWVCARNVTLPISASMHPSDTEEVVEATAALVAGGG